MATKGHLLYYPEGKHDILEGKELNDVLKSKVDSTTKITYLKLKDLRDNSKLIPGSLYRITDYNCTTTQENTQSAGHQFDIVLLALSEDKLAEEGWAMMNESNIYDVTFNDGVTKKCWLYLAGDGEYNIVDVKTLLGYDLLWIEPTAIDEDNKVVILNSLDSTELTIENLTYNYFQNSNLSAWKVWYCLDNDKSRFAWADDSVDSVVVSINANCLRDTSKDNDFDGYYGWTRPATGDLAAITLYTTTENPQVGDITFDAGKVSPVPLGEVVSVQTEGTGLPNGRGVIYRLIDEWNNDVGYDFKNIQFIRKLTDGEYNSDGEDTWCYTFSYYDSNSDNVIDSSLGVRFEGEGDDYTIEYSKLNIIKTNYLDSNVFIDLSSCNEIINSGNNTFIRLLNSKIVDTHGINGLQGVSPDEGMGSLILMSCYNNLDGNSFPTKPNIIIENRALISE